MTQIIATAEEYIYKGWDKVERTAYRVTFENEPTDCSIESLSIYREALERYAALEATPENTAIVDRLEDYARDLAEENEVLFVYDRAGKTRTYSPVAHWEPSGSCSEWEQSAQEGYDFGWGILD